MKLHRIACFGLLVMIAALIAGTGIAVAEKESEVEREVSLDQVPTPVKETILRELGEFELRELEEVREGDVLYYEAEWLDSGMEVEIQVAVDGKLLGKEVEAPDDEDDDDDAGGDDD